MILTWGALGLTTTPYLVEFGMDTGAPENVYEAMALMLQDGEVELSARASNRTLEFNVLIEGATLLAVATAEAALIAEAEKPLNTLTLDPGDSGPVAVFDTFRGQVTLVRDDAWETARIRRYSVTVRAYPYPRSASPFTSTPLGAGGTTTTLLDACSATTGWTGLVDSGSVAPATAGGAVTLTATLTRGVTHAMSLQKTFAAATTSTKFLVIDWKPPAGTIDSTLTAVGDSVSLPTLAEGPSPTAGYTRTWFYVAASSLAVTKIEWTGKFPGPPTLTFPAVFSIDNVAVSDVTPISGTNRQQLRSLTVPGSTRTQGSLAIESATAALGDALVYVYPKDATTTGYLPSLRQFRFSGNTVTGDSAQVSGSTEPINGGSGVTFNVPVPLFPVGSYLLMGRLATSGGGTPTISYTGKTLVGGTSVADFAGIPIQVTTTTAYQIFALGRIQLPTSDLDPGAVASVAFMSLVVTASAAVTYDELWLFNTSIGRLIRVNCGTGAGAVGGSARRLFIEPATVTTPRPTVRIGHSADRSDSFYPQTFTAWQPPEFKPPQVNVLVVTPNATDATISLSGYARWHTNPGS